MMGLNKKKVDETPTAISSEFVRTSEARRPKDTSHGSGHQSGTYYKIEVRSTYSEPTVIPLADGKHFVIDQNWRQWPIRLAPYWTDTLKVPVVSYDGEAASHGLSAYTAAEAHRWLLLAWLEAAHVGGTLCIETRFVEVRMETRYSITETGVTDALEKLRGSPTTHPRFPEWTTESQ